MIYHCDVTSHFPDPIAEFKTMKQRLTENGLLIFETGNMGDVRADRLPQIPRFQYPDHLFFLSTANIGTLLDRTGFQLLGMSRYSIVPELWMNKALRKLRGKKPASAKQPATERSKARPMSPLVAQVRFSIRYHLGALAPVKDHHQTIIVVAKAA